MRSTNTILTEEIVCARWSLDRSVGLVTTLVFIIAVSELAPARFLLVVLSEVLAGGISMALGGYLAARTAKHILDQRIAIERYEIEHEPDEERAELVAIYQHKGFTGAVKARSTRQHPVWAGLEFLVVVTFSNGGWCGSGLAPACRMSLTWACLPSRVQVALWFCRHATAIHQVPMPF